MGKELLFTVDAFTWNRMQACAKDTFGPRTYGSDRIRTNAMKLDPVGPNSSKVVFASPFSGVSFYAATENEEAYKETVYLTLLPLDAQSVDRVEVYKEDGGGLKVLYTGQKIEFTVSATTYGCPMTEEVSQKIEDILTASPIYQVRVQKRLLKEMLQRINRISARGCDSVVLSFAGEDKPIRVTSGSVDGIGEFRTFLMPMRMGKAPLTKSLPDTEK